MIAYKICGNSRNSSEKLHCGKVDYMYYFENHSSFLEILSMKHEHMLRSVPSGFNSTASLYHVGNGYIHGNISVRAGIYVD